MNEFDDVDRELQAAFTQRPTVLSRPSLRDVKRRARRHQHQRSAGVLGACALVGVGGVAVLAQRSPANQTAIGVGEATFPADCSTATTTITFLANGTSTVPLNTWPAVSTTINTVPTTVGYSFYVLQAGDNPTGVAQQHGVTLGELNAANAGTSGYDIFYVGLEVLIPAQVTPTTPPPDDSILTYYVLQDGDYPKAVADSFGVTLEELNTANVETEGYGGWILGTAIRIPLASVSAATTTWPVGPNDPNPVSYPNCLSVSDSTVLGIDTTLSPYTTTTTTTTTISLTPTTFTFTKVGTSIQVVNCSSQEGVAYLMSRALAAEGFMMVEPDTGTINLSMTKVIYNPDDPAALAVAQSLVLLLGNAAVEPSGPVVPSLLTGTWAPGSAVMVLLGDDLAGQTLAQIAQQTYTGTTIAATTSTTP